MICFTVIWQRDIINTKRKGGTPIWNFAYYVYFLAVAREGNITGAANSLHLSQPTLSRQIRDLEEELGHPLLIRKSHRVALTPEGVLFRKRAEEIIAMVDKTEAEFTSMQNTVGGDILHRQRGDTGHPPDY